MIWDQNILCDHDSLPRTKSIAMALQYNGMPEWLEKDMGIIYCGTNIGMAHGFIKKLIDKGILCYEVIFQSYEISVSKNHVV